MRTVSPTLIPSPFAKRGSKKKPTTVARRATSSLRASYNPGEHLIEVRG
jgi:hypothetical protein